VTEVYPFFATAHNLEQLHHRFSISVSGGFPPSRLGPAHSSITRCGCTTSRCGGVRRSRTGNHPIGSWIDRFWAHSSAGFTLTASKPMETAHSSRTRYDMSCIVGSSRGGLAGCTTTSDASLHIAGGPWRSPSSRDGYREALAPSCMTATDGPRTSQTTRSQDRNTTP